MIIYYKKNKSEIKCMWHVINKPDFNLIVIRGFIMLDLLLNLLHPSRDRLLINLELVHPTM